MADNTDTELDRILVRVGHRSIMEAPQKGYDEIVAEAKSEIKQLILADRQAQKQSIPMVNGLDCPACGHPTLILGDGGFITCAYIGCSNPDYAEAQKEQCERAVLEAKISAAKEILEYRSYDIGVGAAPIIMPKGVCRRFVDEFDFKGHINSWQSELAALQREKGEGV